MFSVPRIVILFSNAFDCILLSPLSLSQSLALFSLSYILTTSDDPYFLHARNRAHIVVTNCFYTPKVCIIESLASNTYNMHVILYWLYAGA